MENSSTYNIEETRSRELRIKQEEARKKNNSSNESENRDKKVLTKKVKKKRSPGKKALLEKRIKRKIKKEKFDGLAFYSALILASANDLLDVLTLGTMGSFLVFVIDPLLWVILWMNGSSKTETKIKRSAIATTLEFIPILNLMPLWTITIIYVKLVQSAKVRKLNRQLGRL